MNRRSIRLFAMCLAALAPARADAAVFPVVTTNTLPVRIMAANLTTGDNFRYEAPALRIFQGLDPDIVAVQEFRYASTNGAGIDTPNAFREMVTSAFGTNFTWFRESGAGYTIPNGIISRWPIMESGSWEDADAGVNDRGFAWARIDLPGTNDLFVVSVHLKSSAGTDNVARRTAEAEQVKSLVLSMLTNFPANSLVVVAGDCNIHSSTEGALATFKSFLTDSPIPADSIGDADTNLGRDKRFDYIFPNAALQALRVPTVIGAQSFANGLVFVSTNFTPLASVSPVQFGDSIAPNMQHMAVVKDFRFSYTVTNFINVPPPALHIVRTNVIRWGGVSNLTYTVLTGSTLSNWAAAGSATSAGTNYFFTNAQPATNRRYYRVVYP